MQSSVVVLKKCSGIKGHLLLDSEFRCVRCLGTARAIDERQSLEVEVGNEKLEVVPEFCYLGTCSLQEVAAS